MGLGELGTEQFRVITSIDDRIIGDQMIHDPFIYNKTVIGLSHWDLCKALFKRQFEIHVSVKVHATEGALRAVMMLDPVALQTETDEILAQRAISRERYASMGLVTEGVRP